MSYQDMQYANIGKAEFMKKAEEAYEELMSRDTGKLIDIEEAVAELSLELRRSLLQSKLELELKKKSQCSRNVRNAVEFCEIRAKNLGISKRVKGK